MIEGRELDAAVGTALGWSHWQSKHGHWKAVAPDGTTYEPMYGAPKLNDRTGEPIVYQWWDGVDDLPEYSTDLASSWIIVEHLNALGWLVTVKQMPEGVPYLLESDPESIKVRSRVVVSLQWVQWMKDSSATTFRVGETVVADTVPVGICRAVLRVAPPQRAEGRA